MTGALNRRVKAKARYLALLLVFVVAVAIAAWRGVFDMPEDPRTSSWENIAAFIFSTVNQSVGQWSPGDTFTVCYAGGDSCVLIAYGGSPSSTSYGLFKYLRNIDRRNPTAEPSFQELLQQFLDWLRTMFGSPRGGGAGSVGLVIPGDLTIVWGSSEEEQDPLPNTW